MYYACVLVGLDWAEPMMFFILHVTCSCISHAYVLSFHIFDIFELLGTFLIVLLFFSTLAQNPLGSSASSSTDLSPSTVQFRDDEAFKAFLENFSRRGIHSKCQVVLSDFANTDLPSVIHSRGWESLCDVWVTCPLMLI